MRAPAFTIARHGTLNSSRGSCTCMRTLPPPSRTDAAARERDTQRERVHLRQRRQQTAADGSVDMNTSKFTLNTGATIPCVGLGTWQAEVRPAAASAAAAAAAAAAAVLCLRLSCTRYRASLLLRRPVPRALQQSSFHCESMVGASLQRD